MKLYNNPPDGLAIGLDLPNGWTVFVPMEPCGGSTLQCLPTVDVGQAAAEQGPHVHDDGLVVDYISEVGRRPPPNLQ